MNAQHLWHKGLVVNKILLTYWPTYCPTYWKIDETHTLLVSHTTTKLWYTWSLYLWEIQVLTQLNQSCFYFNLASSNELPPSLPLGSPTWASYSTWREVCWETRKTRPRPHDWCLCTILHVTDVHLGHYDINIQRYVLASDIMAWY